MLKISEEIDSLLNTILEDYKQRATLEYSLQNCDKGDYGKDSKKGKSLTKILAEMEHIELKILWNIAKLLDNFNSLCKKNGISSNRLDSTRFFRPYQAIEQTFAGCKAVPKSFFKLGCKTYNTLIQRSKQSTESKEPSGLVAARHLVQFDKDVYDVVAMIQSLIRMWSLVLESNLDCEKHTFVNQSRSVEVDMWVHGSFFEAATKCFSPTGNNKQAQILNPELKVVKRDIQARLKRIELYYHERYDSRDVARELCGRDSQKRTEAYQRAILKIQVAEDNLLCELYHLGDNVKKYLTKCSRSEDFKVVENFKPYRWCGNYVNHLKHGSRGKNRPIAMPGYITEYYDRKGPKPTVEDKLVDCAFMINIDGRLENEMEIVHRLIDIWFLFLRYHSDIDLTDIKAKINSIRRKEFLGKSLYTAKIPDGVLDDAKRQAQERRKLNL